MANRPYILHELTWKVVRDTRYEVAVLPWGATEAHNYHLPYTTDNIQAEEVAARAAERAWQRGAKVVVLPTVPFGVNTGQLDIPLCINMNPSTQALVLRDVAISLAAQGIPKLVVFNGHGANDFRQMIRELQPLGTPFICVVNWYKVIDPKGYFSDLGDHAGELETSVMQHIAPERAAPLSEAGSGAAKKFTVAALPGALRSPRGDFLGLDVVGCVGEMIVVRLGRPPGQHRHLVASVANDLPGQLLQDIRTIGHDTDCTTDLLNV